MLCCVNPKSKTLETPGLLCRYKEAWDSFVDAWLVVKVASPDWVYRWRWQAEEQLWKQVGHPQRCCRHSHLRPCLLGLHGVAM